MQLVKYLHMLSVKPLNKVYKVYYRLSHDVVTLTLQCFDCLLLVFIRG